MVAKKIKLPFKAEKAILSLGSQTKNTVCFMQGEFAYLSPLHQDLSSPKDFFSFERDAKYFLKKKPKIIACDLHPEYQSTKYGQNLRLTLPDGRQATYDLRLIQHHHAHIAACMAENGIKNQKVIGVAFDGTGLGIDNKLWGAEFLICDYKNFQRAAHLKAIPLLGGERAILEPWRLAAAWTGQAKDKKIWQVLKKMHAANLNSPLASSMGRLFDAVASLVLEKEKANFEAALAIELEKLALSFKLPTLSYKFRINKNNNTYVLDPLPMFRQIIADLKTKKPKAGIAYRFHLTVANMIKKTCILLRKNNKINRIVLSGGVFQNKILLSLSLGLLAKDKFEVFTHKFLPSSDANLALGQAVIASFRN
jgi:hydrogenase maturation protein HypF